MENKKNFIINEHWCRTLLERETLDYSKFYRNHLEQFLDVAREDVKKYKTRNENAIKILKEYQNNLYLKGKKLDEEIEKVLITLMPKE